MLSFALWFALADVPADDAQTPAKVLILDGTPSPGVSEKLHQEFRDGLHTTLQTGEFVTESHACQGACDPSAIARDQHEFVVSWRAVKENRDYHLEVELWEPTAGAQVAQIARDCEICGASHAHQRLLEAASLLAQRLTELRTRQTALTISSSPTGAQVRCDGGFSGTTPATFEHPPGPYSCVVESPGHHPARLEAVLGMGTQEHRELRLEPILRSDQEKLARQQRALRISGFVTLAVAAGTLASSVPMFTLHHEPVESKCAPEDIDVNGRCPFRYSTWTAGITLASIGAAAMVTSIGLLVGSRRTRLPVDVAWAPDRLHVGWRGRF